MRGRSCGSCARFAYRHLAPSGKLIVAALAYVDLVADPLSGLTVADVETLPKPTIRRIRHTCITMNDDAGVSRELIRAFTRHGLDTIDQVLKCYAAATPDQAAAALNTWLAQDIEGRSALSCTSQHVRLGLRIRSRGT